MSVFWGFRPPEEITTGVYVTHIVAHMCGNLSHSLVLYKSPIEVSHTYSCEPQLASQIWTSLVLLSHSIQECILVTMYRQQGRINGAPHQGVTG